MLSLSSSAGGLSLSMFGDWTLPSCTDCLCHLVYSICQVCDLYIYLYYNLYSSRNNKRRFYCRLFGAKVHDGKSTDELVIWILI